MDRDLDALTALLLDPFLTTGEAEREAAAATRPAPLVSPPARRSPARRASVSDPQPDPVPDNGLPC